jgi:hypothetical protein
MKVRSIALVCVGVASVAGVLGVLPGCLIASTRSASVTGREVTSAELNSIRPGETTEADVLTRLGAPTTTTQLSDGGKLHTWSATTTERSSGAVFLIFAGTSEKNTTRSVNVSCKDGLVTAVQVK